MPSISGTTHEARVRAALESAFPAGLTARQIQAVVSFSKLVRFRARSNNALYPLCSRIFRWCKATFTTVPVTSKRGQTFEALVVNVPVLFDGIEKKDTDTEEPLEE